MKTKLALTVVALLAFCQSCTTLTQDQKIAIVRSVSIEAANVGAKLTLAQNPEYRPAFVLAQQSLAAMVKSGMYDPLVLQTNLAQIIALGGMHGETGAVIAEGGFMLYTLSLGFVDLSAGSPYLAATVNGLEEGLRRALATAPALQAAVHAKPVKRCVIPPRK